MLSWDELQMMCRGTVSERIHAIIIARTRAKPSTPDGQLWPKPLRFAVSIRNKVVYSEYEPTVEDALLAVHKFRCYCDRDYVERVYESQRERRSIW